MKQLLFIILILFSSKISLADSPLTSTPFWMAYEDEKEIKYAKENGLDEKVLKQLAGKKLSCDKKLAIINCFGWGSGYTETFENYLLEKRKGLTRDVFKYLKSDDESMPEENEQTKLLTTDDLVCWSILKSHG